MQQSTSELVAASLLTGKLRSSKKKCIKREGAKVVACCFFFSLTCLADCESFYASKCPSNGIHGHQWLPSRVTCNCQEHIDRRKRGGNDISTNVTTLLSSSRTIDQRCLPKTTSSCVNRRCEVCMLLLQHFGD